MTMTIDHRTGIFVDEATGDTVQLFGGSVLFMVKNSRGQRYLTRTRPLYSINQDPAKTAALTRQQQDMILAQLQPGIKFEIVEVDAKQDRKWALYLVNGKTRKRVQITTGSSFWSPDNLDPPAMLQRQLIAAQQLIELNRGTNEQS